MSVQMAQAKIKTEHITDVRVAAEKLFAALDAAQPGGVRYGWYVLPDGETFVALAQLDDGVENPIPALPEFEALQASIAGSLAEPPDSQALTPVGSYRLF
jgi:hypothetical protein